MPDTAPLGEPVTVLMTVDSTSKVALYSGGDKIAEQDVSTNPDNIPLTVSTLRIGATDPGGYNPSSLLVEKISAWAVPLAEADALMVSADITYTPGSGSAPLPVLTIPTALSVKEGDTVQIPVTKTGTGACSATIRTIAQGATLNVDYTGFSQTVTFGADVGLVEIPLTALADQEPDPGEKFHVVLEAANGCTLGSATTIVTITEPPRISLPTTASVREGGVLSLIVTKTNAGACSCTWRTLGDSATTPVDYTGVSATTLSFAAAETSKTITVTTLTDALVEGDEKFQIVLENAIGCTITTPSCTITLLDANSAEVPEQTALTTAKGYASEADCGLGYPVWTVTNLNDTGAGSLREACGTANRMVIFAVAGRIQLASTLSVAANVTIAGETAPAPGITIQKKELSVRQSNVRISHITFERGYEDTDAYRDNGDVGKVGTGSSLAANNDTVANPDTVTRIKYENIHFSHCAFYWGCDETLQHWPWNTHTLSCSYHDCIIADAVYRPSDYDPALRNHIKMYEPYKQPSHNYGLLFGYQCKKCDIQNTLFANLTMRCPFIDHSTEIVIANNLANNCRAGATIQQNPYYTVNAAGTKTAANLPVGYTYKVTCRGYLMISGPDSGGSSSPGFRFNSYRIQQPDNAKVYVQPGTLYSMKGPTGNGTPGTSVTYSSSSNGFGGVVGKPYWLNGTTQVAVEVSTPPIDTPTPTSALTAQEIYDRAVLNVGPRPKEIRALMAGTMTIGNKEVRRSIQQLKDKTGRWPNHQDETAVGGFYAPAQVNRAFTSSATFRDGVTLIGTVPAQPQPATATSKAAMKAWLRKHLDQIQND